MTTETVYRFGGDAGELLRTLAGVRAGLASAGNAAKQFGAEFDSSLRTQSAGFRLLDAARAAANAREKKTYEDSLRGLSQVGKAAKLTANEMTQVGYQLSDAASQLTTGTNPFTILVQQGPQLTGALGGTSSALSKISSLFSVARIAGGLLAATVGAVALAMIQGHREANAFELSLLMTGNRAGLTTTTMETLTVAVARNANVTNGAAREATQAVVSAGVFGAQAVGAVSTAVALYSKRTGQSADEVAKDFARMADGAAAFAREKNKTLNFLTTEQYKYIRSLEASGQVEKAQAETARLMSERLGKKLPQDLGYLETAWNAVARAASGAWQAMKDAGKPDTLDDKLARVRTQLQEQREALEFAKGDKFGARGSKTEIAGRTDAVAKLEAQEESLRLARQAEQKSAELSAADAAKNAREIEAEQKAGIEAKLALQRAGSTSSAAIAELARQKELIANERAYDEGLTTIAGYMAKKAALEQQGLDAKLKAISVEIALEKQRAPENVNETKQQTAKLIELESRRNAVLAERLKLNEQIRRGELFRPGPDAAKSPADQMREFEHSNGMTAAAQAESDRQRRLSALGMSHDILEDNKRLTAELIQDEVKRGEALLAIELEQFRKRQDLGALTEEERKTAEDRIAEYTVLRTRQLNEQLKPEWQRNLDAWRDNTRLMRDIFNELQTDLQKAGEDTWVNFLKTGKISLSSLKDIVVTELGRLSYRQTIAPLIAKAGDAIGGLFGMKPGGSAIGDAGEAAKAAATQAATASVTGLGTSAAGAALYTDLMSSGAEAATEALYELATSAAAAGAKGGGGAGDILSMFGIGGGGAGAGAGTGLEGLSQEALIAAGLKNGGAFGADGVRMFAKGDIFDRPTLFRFANGGGFRAGVMGEAGPEAVMPLKRGRNGKLGVVADGMGGRGSNTFVTVENNSGATAVVQKTKRSNGDEDVRVIINAAADEVERRIANGGSTHAVLEGTYGVQRQNARRA